MNFGPPSPSKYLLPPDLGPRTARLAVRWDGEAWKLLDGRPWPNLKDGTEATLVLPAHDILDQQANASWTREVEHTMLPANTPVFAQVRDEALPKALARCRLYHQVSVARAIYSVEVRLLEPLVIRLRAGKPGVLKSCPCEIPGLERRKANSLNQAYTAISMAFAPTRQSHTGNVFQFMWVQRVDGWLLLEDMRAELEKQSGLPNLRVAPDTKPKSQPAG